jgi:hypothetical protein
MERLCLNFEWSIQDQFAVTTHESKELVLLLQCTVHETNLPNMPCPVQLMIFHINLEFRVDLPGSNKAREQLY